MGTLGIIILGSALLLHDVHHSDQHSEELTLYLLQFVAVYC